MLPIIVGIFLLYMMYRQVEKCRILNVGARGTYIYHWVLAGHEPGRLSALSKETSGSGVLRKWALYFSTIIM
jgi:hypothetical protein